MSSVKCSQVRHNAASQPKAATVQTVATLNYNDRVFFFVQNKDSTGSITVEFLKLIAWQ
jgi:hypothetical protein